jgi:hypothetical protein
MKRMGGNRIFHCLVVTALIVGGLLPLCPEMFKGGADGGVRPALAALSVAEAAKNSDGERLDNDDVVTATGIGKIISPRTISSKLARRAALSDARRNLLIEARRIREGVQGKPSVSGYVGPHWIVSERREGFIYRITLAARLSDLHVD